MRRAAVVLCLLGCYPTSELALPVEEGYHSAIVLGRDDERIFATASPTDRIVLPFTARDDVLLEALFYRASLVELGIPEGPLAQTGEGRTPPGSDAILRTTIVGGEFSGWDDVDESELAPSIRIPWFDPSGCTGCIAVDDRGDPSCKLDCIPAAPEPPQPAAAPMIDALTMTPACDPTQVAYVGESECHYLGDDCPLDGWPAEPVDAYVRPGAAGDGTRETPFGSVLDAIAMGALRVGLSTGTHEFDGHLDSPLELIGACSRGTTVQAVLRTTAPLVVEDVTVMGGIETDDRLDIHRIHVIGGPILANTASVTGSDLALHDSHFVVADSEMTLERVFVSSNLASLSCWGSRIAIDDAVLMEQSGATLSVTSTCTLALSRAILVPAGRGAIVEASGDLTLTDALIVGAPDGGISVREAGRAQIHRVAMSGNDGFFNRGSVDLQDVQIETDRDESSASLVNFGTITGQRIALVGSGRGLDITGGADLDDLTIDTNATGIYVQLGANLDVHRADVTARVTCVDAQSDFFGEDLALQGCETGISTSVAIMAERVTADATVSRGAAVFGAETRLGDVSFATKETGVEVQAGSLEVLRFVISGAALGASLASLGTLSLEQGRLQNLETGLRLPAELRAENVLREVAIEDVARLIETR